MVSDPFRPPFAPSIQYGYRVSGGKLVRIAGIDDDPDSGNAALTG